MKCNWKHKVYTSTAYRYSRESWPEDKNKEVYGADASTSGVGYNLQLEAKADAGLIAEEEFRKRLYKASRLIDHKFVNQDIPIFTKGPVSLEKLANYIKENLFVQGAEVKLLENHRCSVETLSNGELVLSVFGKLSATHRHWNAHKSPVENQNLYGKCSGLHGHEYNIELSVKGSVDKETGLVASRESLMEVLNNKVLAPLQGSFLNDHLGNTSGEKIALEVLRRVNSCLMTQQTYRIVVRETRKNSFVVGAAIF